jgi:sugar lactone lactonase YvrE
MNRYITLVAAMYAAACTGAKPDQVTQQPGSDTGPYEVVANWPQPLPDTRHSHDGWTWGSVGAVYAESPDRIWIAQRGELPLPAGAKPWTSYGMLDSSRGNATGNTDGLSATCGPIAKRGWERRFKHVIFVVDREGKLIDEWPHADSLFSRTACGRGPHKIVMNPHDPAKRLWVFDDQQHVIYRFTYDGKLEKTLGTLGKKGRGPNLFDRPTGIAWFPDGTYFISDGYGGTRVAKYDKDDKFLMDWGQAPKDSANPGPNEFNTVHSVAVSKDRRVFVVDRGHHRIQVFDENGKFLSMFSTGDSTSLPYDHVITEDQHLWLVDGGNDRVAKYDLDGKLLYEWGKRGGQPGQFKGAHAITVDREGNFYTAEVFNGRVQKFKPKAGADAAQVIGPLAAHPAASVAEAPFFENEYARASKNSAPCASGSAAGCAGERIIVAMGDLSFGDGIGKHMMNRGDVSVFSSGEPYDAPSGEFFEVVIKPNHPPVQSPKGLIPPAKNVVLHDARDFFVFEEKLPVGEERGRHGHSQRVVIQLNKTTLLQKPDGAPEVTREIEPNRVTFDPPVMHTTKNVGELPLRGVVIEFKPGR